MSLRFEKGMAAIIKMNVDNLEQHCSGCGLAIYLALESVLADAIFSVCQSKRFLFLLILSVAWPCFIFVSLPIIINLR